MEIIKKNIDTGKKIYFVSDSHLGIPNYKASLEREKKLVSWLDSIKNDAQEIYLLGDIFDFWFEYKHVVPRGYIRLFGKIAEITDSGIPVNFFIGNHDMWVKDYLKNEIGITIHKKPQCCEYNGKVLYISHGDGLGKGDHGYKFIKMFFSNKICQWLFARLHPNFAFQLALFFSKRSRLARGNNDMVFLGEDKERLILFAKQFSSIHNINYFILAHRHLPLDIEIKDNTRYLNTGDWFYNFSYVVFDGKNAHLKYYKTT